VPDDFHGKYRVELSVPLGPIEVSQDEQWFEIE
jgi:hypothetical protein